MSNDNKIKDFLSKIEKGAKNTWVKHKILPSIVTAQAILESGWGGSKLANEGNNLFGIKADKNWKGDVISVITAEYVSGKKVAVTAKFRKYKSWSDSVEDHGLFLNKDRYKNVIGETDYNNAIKAIFNAGYATDPSYISKITRIIEQYNLSEWDKEVTNKKPEVQQKESKYYIKTGSYDSKEQAEQAAKKIKDSKIAWVVEVIEAK